MNFQKIKASKIILFASIMLTLATVTFAQGEKTTIIYDEFHKKPMKVAGMNNMYCAGSVQQAEFDTSLKIVGSDDEKDKHLYAQGDFMYISSGARNGVRVGDKFAVIRPRGKVKTKWSKKKKLGVFVEELGDVEVIKVLNDVSVAKVTNSCGAILLGDLITAVPNRQSPMFTKRKPLEKFSVSSGKAQGRIFMARDRQEVLGREQIVYIDLGREDSVSNGDYLTIYRKLGTGNIFSKVLKETVGNKDGSKQSDRYRGGTFSNQAARTKGKQGTGKNETSESAKKHRPKDLRKVVGELIILNVYEKTATAMIVRNASEIHTGDQVEVQ